MRYTAKIITSLLILLGFAYVSDAQSVSWTEIKESGDYYYGEGYGSTVAAADNNALANLMSKISVTVSNSFEVSEEEKTYGDNFNSESYVRSKISTFSNGTLTNTQMLILRGGGMTN